MFGTNSRVRTLRVGIALVVGVTGCAGEKLTFAEWEIALPEGIAVLEYAPVPVAERTERIRVVEDLVIGPRGDDANYAFYRPLDLGVDDDGRIYVFDSGNARIQVFDASGNYLRSIGREGSGPGEFDGGGRIAVAGDTLVRSGDNRLSAWNVGDGELQSDRQVTFTRFLFPIHGTDAGAVIGRYVLALASDDGAKEVIAEVSLDATVVRDLATFVNPGGVRLTRADTTWGVSMPVPTVALSAARSGDVYATQGAEYQVLAWSASGEPRWAIRVAWPRLPVIEDEIQTALDSLRERLPDVQRSEVSWPGFHPALADRPRGASVRADGHGHVYVLPFVRRVDEGSPRPVDVYGADGAPLFSGLIDDLPWIKARGDFVYALTTNAITEEREMTRYRLVEPFE